MNKIDMPNGAALILDKLKRNGFESFCVGGCVRDSLLDLQPKDWDICTSALPEQVEEIFKDNRIIETGLKHGTVTIIMDDGQYEVTTFRTDGVYSDCRRPDNVTFVRNVEDDLARRDFTINALAYDGERLIDLYGGVRHLEQGVIACVGNADDRFNEDALRIMRALRFASVYGFKIADETANAIHKNAKLLNNIAVERINVELCKLLCGKGAMQILLDYNDIIATIIPEFKPCIGFNQNNHYHQYTVYDHIAHAVDNYRGADSTVKLALFFHDIGKPTCYTEDENGGHFHGHGIPSRDITERVLQRLRFDNKTQRDVTELVLYHDSVIEPTPKTVKRWLNKIGEEQLLRLLDIRMADILAHAEGTQESRIERCIAVRELVDSILAENQCFTIKDLTVCGTDVLDLGVPQGKLVGEILNHLLDKVISGELDNKREVLMDEAKYYLGTCENKEV